MLSVLVLLLVVAAASFAYRAFWMLRARPSSRYVGSRFRDEVVAMSRRQRRRAFWGNVLLCVLCVAAMVLVGVLVDAWAARCDRPSSFRFRPVGVSGGLSSCVWA